jgi:zinc D-Ala-D-Ala carboxypeptidase
LQRDLNYVINAGLATDGIIGDKSVAAIKSFQRKYGLSVDGIYGNKSYNKMKSLLQ